MQVSATDSVVGRARHASSMQSIQTWVMRRRTPLQKLLQSGGQSVSVEGGPVCHTGIHCRNQLPDRGAAALAGWREGMQRHQHLRGCHQRLPWEHAHEIMSLDVIATGSEHILL